MGQAGQRLGGVSPGGPDRQSIVSHFHANPSGDPVRGPAQLPPEREVSARGAGRDHVKLALALAVLADGLQVLLLPAFVEGGLAPWDAALDVGVAAIMIALLGWHVAFLPSFMAKLVPVVDLFPSWTGAVLFVAAQRALRRRKDAAEAARRPVRAAEVEVVPPPREARPNGRGGS